MFRSVLSVAVLMVLGSVASAAIVYEPVQYQYRDAGRDRPTFYYGGSNPAVLEAGALHQHRYQIGANPVRNIGFGVTFVGPLTNDLLHHGLMGCAPVTYTDLLPAGMNAWPLGFTADDARNEAYGNVPLYFRKGDLMESAYRGADGSVVVPAQAPLPGTISITPSRMPTTRPATQGSPQPIMIFPKGLLDRRLNTITPGPVASAR